MRTITKIRVIATTKTTNGKLVSRVKSGEMKLEV